MKNRKQTKKVANNNQTPYNHVWISRPLTPGLKLIADSTRAEVRYKRSIVGSAHYATPEKIIIID